MKFSISNRVLHKYEKESSKLRNFCKEGSWSIKLEWLQDVDDIIYETSKYIYRISKSKVQEKGFKKVLNGEPKYIVHIPEWHIVNK